MRCRQCKRTYTGVDYCTVCSNPSEGMWQMLVPEDQHPSRNSPVSPTLVERLRAESAAATGQLEGIPGVIAGGIRYLAALCLEASDAIVRLEREVDSEHRRAEARAREACTYEGRTGCSFARSEIGDRQKLLAKACDAAFAFIDSHVADPDLTDEMVIKHAEYIEARRALEGTP